MVEPAAATFRRGLISALRILRNETGREVGFENGNITGEEFRRLIVGDIGNIKKECDGKEGKYLRSSVCFLQDGVSALCQAIEQSHLVSSDSVTTAKAVSSRDSDPGSPVNDAIALVNVMQPLRDHKRLRTAIRDFNLARRNATSAFLNDASSIEERFEASRIRMIARILENLVNFRDPNVGVGDCLRYFKQLFDIEDVRKVFSSPRPGLLDLESYFYRKKRRNIVTAVEAMNQDLFEFAKRFTELPPNIYDWATISLDETLCDLMLENSKGEIVEIIRKEGSLKIFKDSRELCDVVKESAVEVKVCAMDVDKDDDVYVITASRGTASRGTESRGTASRGTASRGTASRGREHESLRFRLSIIDSIGNKKLACALPFFQNHFVSAVSMAVNRRGVIAILDRVNKTMFLGHPCTKTNAYKVEKSFNLKELPLSIHFSSKSMRFFYANGVKIVVLGRDSVFIYNVNGELEGKIRIPEEYGTGLSLEVDNNTQRYLIEAWKPVKSSYYNLVQLLENPLLSTSSVVLYGVQGAGFLQPL